MKYKVTLKDDKAIDVDNPSYWPDPMKIKTVSEPFIKALVHYAGRIRWAGYGPLPRASVGEPGDELSLGRACRSD